MPQKGSPNGDHLWKSSMAVCLPVQCGCWVIRGWGYGKTSRGGGGTSLDLIDSKWMIGLKDFSMMCGVRIKL